MKQEDAKLLGSYRAAQEFMADRIRQTGGDPETPTPEQAEAAAMELVNRALLIKQLFDPGSPLPTADGIMRDHRKLQRLKKRRDQ